MDIIKIIESIAITIASICAIFGINSWRNEMKGRKEYDLAEEVLSLFYEAKDAINDIRNPFGYVGEGRSRKPANEETQEQKKARDMAYVVFERYQKNKKVFNRLNSLRYRFMAVFGKNNEKPFYELKSICDKILQAAHMLGTLWERQTRPLRTTENTLENIKKYEEVIWWTSESDHISQNVDKLVSEIDDFCKKIIKPKNSLFSRIINRIKSKIL